jgi:divalent metal cation (Fe/Co/Zn/Cd) transporter
VVDRGGVRRDGLKLAAWRLTGSVALYSDALESTVNVIAATVAIRGDLLRAEAGRRRPPVRAYKAEYFSAVIEGVLIVVAALLIVREAAARFFAGDADQRRRRPRHQPGGGGAQRASGPSILIRNGRAHRSPALVADGRHIMTDVVTSLGVFAGLVAALAPATPSSTRCWPSSLPSTSCARAGR